MSKELSKTYDPKDIEDRLYKKWEDNGYFHAEVDRRQKAFYNCNATTKYYWSAPYGPCTGQYHAGYSYSL